jgi:uncharacterized membrane protein
VSRQLVSRHAPDIDGRSTRVEHARKKSWRVTVSTRQLPVTGRATFVTRPVFCGIFAIPSYFGIAQLCAPAAGM